MKLQSLCCFMAILAAIALLAESAVVEEFMKLLHPKQWWWKKIYQRVEKPANVQIKYPHASCSGECKDQTLCHGYTFLNDGNCWLFQFHGPDNKMMLNVTPESQLDWDIYVKRGYAKPKVKDNVYGVFTGLTVTNWTRMIRQEMTWIMDQPSEDFCAYYCWHIKGGSRIFVLDGNRCLCGQLLWAYHPQLTTPLVLHDSSWNFGRMQRRIPGPTLQSGTKSERFIYKHIFEVQTLSTANECHALCVIGYDVPKSCEIVHYDSSSSKCYLGNFMTDNEGSFTIPSGFGEVLFEPGRINGIVDPKFLYQGTFAPSVWKQHMFSHFTFPGMAAHNVDEACKAACYFSLRPCTMYLQSWSEGRVCFLGHRDVKNELSNITGNYSLALFESKGAYHIAVGYYHPGAQDNKVSITPLTADSSVSSCMTSPMPYPLKMRHLMVGKLLDGRPIGCGGVDTANAHRKDCYAFDVSSNTWVRVADLLWPVYGAGFDSHPDWGFVMAGGVDAAAWRREIQITEDGSSFSHTISMEEERYAHCLVIHDYNTLYIIGGFRWTEHYTKSMRQYTKTGGWSAGSDLQTGLQWIEGCHKFAKDGTWGILVVGGWDSASIRDVVQLYTPGSGWSTLTPFADGTVYGQSSAASGGTFYIAGGQGSIGQKRLYKYEFDGTWTRVSPDLANPHMHTGGVILHAHEFDWLTC